MAVAILLSGFVVCHALCWPSGADKAQAEPRPTEILGEKPLSVFVKARTDFRSLLAEWEIRDGIDAEENTCESGSLKLFMDNRRNLLMRYERLSPSASRQDVWLLTSDHLYVVDVKRQYGLRMRLAGKSGGEVVGRLFMPWSLFVDRKQADKAFKLRMTKRDSWYTYWAFDGMAPGAAFCPGDRRYAGIAAIANDDNDNIDKGMPKELRVYGTWPSTIVIRKLRVNKDKLSVESMEPPQTWTKWQIRDCQLNEKVLRWWPLVFIGEWLNREEPIVPTIARDKKRS